MDKQSFILQIKPILKELNYKKKDNYWYKRVDNHICCINVQGSQWDKKDYYVEIGFSFYAEECKTPRLLQWHCRHRCKGASGEKNISASDLLLAMKNTFEEVSVTEQITTFLQKHKAVKVVSQFWF